MQTPQDGIQDALDRIDFNLLWDYDELQDEIRRYYETVLESCALAAEWKGDREIEAYASVQLPQWASELATTAVKTFRAALRNAFDKAIRETLTDAITSSGLAATAQITGQPELLQNRSDLRKTHRAFEELLFQHFELRGRGGSQPKHQIERVTLQRQYDAVYPIWQTARDSEEFQSYLQTCQPLLLAHYLNRDLPGTATDSEIESILNLPREAQQMALQHAAHLCDVPLCTYTGRQLLRILNISPAKESSHRP